MEGVDDAVALARTLGEMRGYVAAYVEDREDRGYLLPRIDACLEALGPPGLSRKVQDATHRAMEDTDAGA